MSAIADMWPYWILFLCPALAALTTRRSAGSLNSYSPRWTAAWVAAVAGLTLFIGYRQEVGGDWLNYFDYLEGVEGLDLSAVLELPDPGYQLLNWLSLQLGWGVFGPNVITAFLFTVGLASFCINQPRPWLALAVAVPYLVIVVGMGYTRQAAALGCALLGLIALQKGSTTKFIVWVLVGATFHKTAVLLLPISALANTRNRYTTALWVVIVTAVAYVVLLKDSAENLYVNYIEAEYQSEGALIRLLMNALPAAVLLMRRRTFQFGAAESRLWRLFAYISLLLLVVLFVTSASAAVDRLALYMLPLQMVVFARLPTVLSRGRAQNQLTVAVIAYYALVQFVWLHFGAHAIYWLPYKFMPLEAAL